MKTKRIIRKAFTVFCTAVIFSGYVFAEELTVVTVNSWSAMNHSGFLRCDEYEEETVRGFRQEVLTTGLKELEADVIILNGINPAESFAAETALELGMNADVWVSRSGIRFGPVSLPLNLKEGDAILSAEKLASEPAGRMSLNSTLSTGAVTLFARDGVQVFGRKIDITAEGESTAGGVYIFSAVWNESLFNDENSLRRLTDAYLSGEINADDYMLLVKDAVEGAETRLVQAGRTLSFINSIAGAGPVIVAGSFNALPDSPEIKVLKDAGFIDVFERAGKGPGYTIDVQKNSNYQKLRQAAEDNGDPAGIALDIMSGKYRTDYIMIRGAGLKPLSAGIVLDKPVYGVYPSNRFGVSAVIDISD